MNEVTHQTRPQVYLSNQLGFSETGRYTLTHLIKPRLDKAGVDVIDPFKECGKLLDFKQLTEIEAEGTVSKLKEFWNSFNSKVTSTNNNLMERSRAMALILDGGHAADDGACSELGYYAHFKDRPVFALRTDFRAADNLSTTINSQLLGYINKTEAAAGGLFDNVDDWVDAIESWAQKSSSLKEHCLSL